MEENRRKSRKGKNQSGAIAVMVTMILIILVSTALLFLPEEENKPKKPTPTPTPVSYQEETIKVQEEKKLAVVLDVDTDIKLLTVYDVVTEEEVKLVYTGASAFFDGYGVQISAAQLEKGGLFYFTIDTKEEWILTGKEAVDRTEQRAADGVWEKTGVDYIGIHADKLSFRNQNYRYSDGLIVMSNGERIALSELEPTMDILTVRGLGQVVYEIVVTKGHGYITLTNHEDFIGGMITIGSTRVDSVSQEARYMVKEGTYQVAVSNGNYSGMESVTVGRDETAVFDLYEYGSGPISSGWLTIQVDPLGATLYVDGKKTAYTDGLELDYGMYHLEFTEGGYISYEATVEINQPRQTLLVYLTEAEGTTETEEDGDTTKDPDSGSETEESPEEEENSETSEDEEPGSSTVLTSVTIRHLGYEYNENNAIYILGPEGAEVQIDGVTIGTAPLDFEKIIGSFVITLIGADGSVQMHNCLEADNGSDSYYNFGWED